MLDKGENKDSKHQETLDELRKGSAEAFKILYEKYRKNVYRFCLRMMGDADMADDAFQETFIKVYEHRKDFRTNNFSSWLFTIARRTCLNQIRSKKDMDTFDEFFYEPVRENRSDVAMKEIIEKAIATLPIPMREAFILREYEECTYQEIADILGIQLSLAKVRVHRAREILRKLLAPIKKEIHES